jgi:hypothetical protein
MTWPKRIYVATQSNGVYYTNDFDGPETQPTWTEVNEGLPTTDCLEFWLCSQEPNDYQYVLLDGSRTLYRRVEGAWESILTIDQCDDLTDYGTVNNIHGFCVDKLSSRLWVAFETTGGKGYWVAYSDDHGDTWTATNAAYTNRWYTYGCGSIRAVGDTLYLPVSSGAGGSRTFKVSDDAGTTWYSYTTDGINALGWVSVNPLTATGYINRWNDEEFAEITPSGISYLGTSIPSARYGRMWFDPSDANHQRSMVDGQLRSTYDGWSTFTSSGAIDYTPTLIAPWSGDDTDQMLIGLTLDGTGQPHVIGALYGEDDTAPVGIAGSSPDAAPYTDSIPYDCGGLARMGIQAVNESGIVRTHAVEMPDYAGADRGTPQAGDRAAWDINHADKHASDIAYNGLKRHLPGPANDGNYARDDGSNWQVQSGIPQDDIIDPDKLDITWEPSTYTPDASPAEVDDVDDLAAHLAGIDDEFHDAVTLDNAEIQAILDLSTQALDLDTQAANHVLAGPSTGADAKPAFRALTLDDLGGIGVPLRMGMHIEMGLGLKIGKGRLLGFNEGDL